MRKKDIGIIALVLTIVMPIIWFLSVIPLIRPYAFYMYIVMGLCGVTAFILGIVYFVWKDTYK